MKIQVKEDTVDVDGESLSPDEAHRLANELIAAAALARGEARRKEALERAKRQTITARPALVPFAKRPN